MRKETRDRVVLPVVIPIAAVLGILFFVFFFSRILLAVDPIFATLIALGLSLNVLTASALVAALPRLRTAVLVGALTLTAVLLAGAGVLAMAVSPEARLAAGEAEGPGGEQPAPGPGGEATPPESPGEQASPPEGGPPPCQPSGTELEVAAPPGAFTDGFAEDCLAAPAGEGFTIAFDNQDPGQTHNVAIYTERGGQPLFQGEIITAPSETAYEVDPLDPGRLWFQCDVHPTAMTGTFVVE